MCPSTVENYCCKEMETLCNPSSGCNISLDDDGRLESCDDYGDRLPPINYCPYCGSKQEIKDAALD